jgi:histidinol phosphatase-like PHP family hydrolase
MIDFHTHSFFSDGDFLPSELVRRAEFIGYKAMAITDHVDISNYDFVVPRIVRVSEELNTLGKVKTIPGAEITHVHPSLIKELAIKVRKLGAKLILVHGETIAEPVEEGTNRYAVEADIDILAHPGLVDDDTCRTAKERGIFFEITSRKGHSLTNGHVAKMALKYDINMVMNSDTHAGGDLLTKERAMKTLKGAGIPIDKIDDIFKNSIEITKKLF